MNEETNDQIEQRRANIQALEEAGREPFPHAWTPTHVTSEVIRAYEEQHGEAREPEPPVRVSIAGRMTARRVMGKASFFDLSDERGRLQVYLARDAIGASFYNEVFRHALDLGDFLGVEGEVFRTRTEFRFLVKRPFKRALFCVCVNHHACAALCSVQSNRGNP